VGRIAHCCCPRPRSDRGSGQIRTPGHGVVGPFPRHTV
jgi:hypothetical protein